MNSESLSNIFSNLLVPTVKYVIYMIQRQSGTLCLQNIVSGSKLFSLYFREFQLTAEGQEQMKMMCSYKDI